MGSINNLAVHRNLAIRDAHYQLAFDQALDIKFVDHFFACRQDFAGEFDFAAAQRTALAGIAAPAEVKANQLPHGVEAKATGHYRISFKMTREKPQVGIDVELGQYATLAFAAAGRTDVGDAVNHQHLSNRQTGVARAEHFPVAATEQLFAGIAVFGDEC